MILWCMSCKEYRKRGTGEWHKCKWKEYHHMTPANEKLENELQKIRARIGGGGGSGGGQNDDEDLKRLGMLEAIKNVDAVDDNEHGRVDNTVEKMVAGSVSLSYDPEAFFYWIRTDDAWDVLKSDSKKLARLVADEHRRRYGESPYGHYVESSLQAYESRAEKKTADRVWRRIGFADGVLWIDLNGPKHRLYRIAPNSNGPSVPYSPDMNLLFERHGAEMPEPEYADGRWLEKFCDLLGIQDNLREIFCVHLCHLFCIHQETPPMAFSGPPGSGKTVAGTLVRDLVNPVGPRNAAWAMPKGRKDLNDALSYSPVVLFDPVSRIGRSTGDALCAACDGGGFLRYDPKRAIPVPFGHVRILLAVQDDCAIKSPSLASRILRYEMRQPSSRWRPRVDIEAEFGRMRPHLYHEIFGVLSRALGETDGGPANTRMADFGVMGRSIARAMGHDGESVGRYREAMLESPR